MISYESEIIRLESRLHASGMSSNEVQTLIIAATSEIEDAISDIMDNAMIEVAQIGDSIGAKEFVVQLRPTKIGGTYGITTESGRTDFSTPPFHMLSSLLQNGKRAKDGSIYKRIPVQGGDASATTNIFDSTARINQQNMEMVQQRRQEREDIRAQGIFNNVLKVTNLQATRQFIERTMETNQAQRKQVRSANTIIRTVSSKQSASTQWVRPAKDLNMQFVLQDINRRIEDQIQEVVVDVMRRYGGI